VIEEIKAAFGDRVPFPDEPIGINQSDKDYEILSAFFIHHELLLKESGLFSSKWFDYKIMHPYEATMHFMYYYMVMYSWYIRKSVDQGMAHGACGFKKIKEKKVSRFKDFTELTPQEQIGLWTARQHADDIGCPYDFFLITANGWCEARGRKNLLRPQQLYHKDLLPHIKDEWEQKKSRQIVFSDKDYYKHTSYRQDPVQNEHIRFVVEQVRKTRMPEFAIAMTVIKNSLVSPNLLSSVFGVDLSDKALKIAVEDENNLVLPFD